MIQFVLFIPVLYNICVHGALLNPVQENFGINKFEHSQEMFNKEWENFLMRDIQLPSSHDPIPSPESVSMFRDLEVEETPDGSGEDEDFFAPSQSLESELEFEQFQNENQSRNTQNINDTVIILIMDEPSQGQKQPEVDFSRNILGSLLCVIPRAQTNCLVRKRCGVYRNDRNQRNSIIRRLGDVFTRSRKSRCSFQCGWKAGRTCGR